MQCNALPLYDDPRYRIHLPEGPNAKLRPQPERVNRRMRLHPIAQLFYAA